MLVAQTDRVPFELLTHEEKKQLLNLVKERVKKIYVLFEIRIKESDYGRIVREVNEGRRNSSDERGILRLETSDGLVSVKKDKLSGVRQVRRKH